MGTMGLALGPCSLPGQVNLHINLTIPSISPHQQSHCQGPLFKVAADAMELGLGVHGEAGVASMPLSNARLVTISPPPSQSSCLTSPSQDITLNASHVKIIFQGILFQGKNVDDCLGTQ